MVVRGLAVGDAARARGSPRLTAPSPNGSSGCHTSAICGKVGRVAAELWRAPGIPDDRPVQRCGNAPESGCRRSPHCAPICPVDATRAWSLRQCLTADRNLALPKLRVATDRTRESVSKARWPGLETCVRAMPTRSHRTATAPGGEGQPQTYSLSIADHFFRLYQKEGRI
jgi:hypothetical protein